MSKATSGVCVRFQQRVWTAVSYWSSVKATPAATAAPMIARHIPWRASAGRVILLDDRWHDAPPLGR